MFALRSTLQRKMPKRLLFSRHGTGWIPYEEACPQKRQTVRKRGTSSPALIYRYKVALCRTFQTRCLQRRSKDFGTRWNRSRWWNIHGTPFSSFQRAVQRLYRRAYSPRNSSAFRSLRIRPSIQSRCRRISILFPVSLNNPLTFSEKY